MPTVFFSWQRDTPPKEGRNFLERALERAIALVAADVELEEAERELELDRDTKGVAGQPPIVETIFRTLSGATSARLPPRSDPLAANADRSGV